MMRALITVALLTGCLSVTESGAPVGSPSLGLTRTCTTRRACGADSTSDVVDICTAGSGATHIVAVEILASCTDSLCDVPVRCAVECVDGIIPKVCIIPPGGE